MRMAEIGLIEGQRVELIDGDIIAMPPMSEAHAQSVDNIHEELGEPFRGTFKIRGQNPFNAGEHGRPEPDIAVVRREALSLDKPPAEAILIIEVSQAVLQYNRTTKASLYASIGIADYWIVNLIENQVEVYRQPIPSQSAQFGHDYASRQIYRSGQSIALLEVPEVSIAVDAMLPLKASDFPGLLATHRDDADEFVKSRQPQIPPAANSASRKFCKPKALRSGQL